MAEAVDTQDEQRALEALRAAYETATQIALTHPDLDQRLEMAEAIREIVETATLIRYQVLVRMYEAEGHSTTRLGERVGFSKQRADQLIKQARKAGIEPSPKS